MIDASDFVIDVVNYILYIVYSQFIENVSRTAMPRLVSAPFFSANPVFRRPEYAAAVGRRPEDKVVTAMLAQHLQGWQHPTHRPWRLRLGAQAC